jgi:5-methylcytosine-specific restriction endonuclease McrA
VATKHGRSGRPWRRIREQVLARDPLCMIRGPRCTRISTTVDHIVPLSVDPSLAHDLSNLRGACGPCNYRGGAKLTNARRRVTVLREVTSLRW